MSTFHKILVVLYFLRLHPLFINIRVLSRLQIIGRTRLYLDLRLHVYLVQSEVLRRHILLPGAGLVGLGCLDLLEVNDGRLFLHGDYLEVNQGIYYGIETHSTAVDYQAYYQSIIIINDVIIYLPQYECAQTAEQRSCNI